MYLGKIMEIGPAEQVIRSPRNPYTQALVSVVADAGCRPTAGTRAAPDDPRRRDARRRPHPDRLPVPSALPAGVRPLPGRGAAAVRRRRRASGRVLARRGRTVAAGAGSRARPRRGPGPGRRAGRAGGLGRRQPRPRGDTTAVPEGFDPADDTGRPGLAPLRPATSPGAARRARPHRGRADRDGRPVGGWRPTPEEWCANECVGHIIEADRRGFGGRIQRILAENGVAESGWDNVGIAAARRDWERPVTAISRSSPRGATRASPSSTASGTTDLER